MATLTSMPPAELEATLTILESAVQRLAESGHGQDARRVTDAVLWPDGPGLHVVTA